MSPDRPRRRATALRAELRQSTAQQHEALHRDPAFSALATGTLTRTDGMALMRRMSRFYRAADPQIARACRDLGISPGLYRYAPRTPLLAEWTTAAIPATVILPAIRSRAGLAGVVYVLDGALMGGAVLDRSSRDMDWIGGYWAWCRSSGPDLWKGTLRLLDTIEPDGRAATLTAARATFDVFAQAVALKATA